MCVHAYVHTCKQLPINQSFDKQTTRVVVSVGGVNGSERQLLTSLIHAA